MKKQIREVRIVDLITYAFLPAPLVVIIWAVLMPLSKEWLAGEAEWVSIAVTVLAVIITYLLVKRFVIGMVLCYKVLAPLETRESCRFYPTCSTYMIMAINKYGAIKGLFRGLSRIFRCRPPSGGIDLP
jgi:putative membrane protein insertion efficiency factor